MSGLFAHAHLARGSKLSFERLRGTVDKFKRVVVEEAIVEAVKWYGLPEQVEVLKSYLPKGHWAWNPLEKTLIIFEGDGWDTAREGCWIVKDEEGRFKFWNEELFFKFFERVK